MEKQITSRYIAISNLRKKPFRTAAMFAVIALSAAVLLSSQSFLSFLFYPLPPYLSTVLLAFSRFPVV